jgi:hypothetical protein
MGQKLRTDLVGLHLVAGSLRAGGTQFFQIKLGIGPRPYCASSYEKNSSMGAVNLPVDLPCEATGEGDEGLEDGSHCMWELGGHGKVPKRCLMATTASPLWHCGDFNHASAAGCQLGSCELGYKKGLAVALVVCHVFQTL